MKLKVKKNGVTTDLIVKSTGFLKPKELWLGDENLGKWPSSSELSKGVVITTSAGDKLEFKMKTFPVELQATFNGEFIEGTASHPDTKIQNAYILMCFISGLNILIGLATIISKAEAMINMGFGVYNLIVGAILFCLLTFGFKEKIFWPLAAGFAIFSIDAVFMVQTMITLKTFNVGPILVRAFLMIPWAKGCIAAYQKKAASPTPYFK